MELAGQVLARVPGADSDSRWASRVPMLSGLDE